MKITRTNEDLLNYSNKYHFYHNKDTGTIVCTTMYKGQMVRGVAKCSPDDNFDLDTGKRLAYLRCRLRYMKKKAKRANAVYKEAVIAEAKARDRLQHMIEFVQDAEEQIQTAANELLKFEDYLLGL